MLFSNIIYLLTNSAFTLIIAATAHKISQCNHKGAIMLVNIIAFFKRIFSSHSHFDSLEYYIVSHNPQSSDDVDRLEREFYANRHQQSSRFY